ncbi:N-succinyl-L,L-diaminopimelate aminotransferase alternative [Rhodovulum sp. PH10]|uniref:aminotransferase class I/II-fold pyridoxal phosphate-dependent enzyme n=1 Tax=Rhodovulum sp. PH10 TaxID=1187851 RepID=UPI00027C29DA|nr:aminotransferase class I/II-fold pyridoxal phosphate-dependent enzyme [Rhodovulum sp. PH10]EJW12836.1 N-succinyl-L,L-diaminopimelate aminotransferase alternative [Rhodovulum sp. PH10]
MSSSAADPEIVSAPGTAIGRSPFVRLNELLSDVAPGKPPIVLSLGEPQHPVPGFVAEILGSDIASLGRYPAGKGTPAFRTAAAQWLAGRYGVRMPDPETEILVLNGTREGLFLAAVAARRFVAPRRGTPAVLVPNPFYAVYPAGADAAGCETVFLPATRETGFLPDLDALDEALLARTVAFYLASPANPQGAVAELAYLSRLVSLARRHGFLVFADECYSEIYTREKPPGILEAAGEDFADVVVFQSLSKRSNLPGLRVGFAAGDERFLKTFLELRNVAAPTVPVPAQLVGAAAYADEAHVDENRRLYARKFEIAEEIVGTRYGWVRPAGGFYLWLDVSAHGGSEQATLALWREAGVKVLPGRYIARDRADGSNPGADFIRVAIVQDEETTAEALRRLVAVLG